MNMYSHFLSQSHCLVTVQIVHGSGQTNLPFRNLIKYSITNTLFLSLCVSQRVLVSISVHSCGHLSSTDYVKKLESQKQVVGIIYADYVLVLKPFLA